MANTTTIKDLATYTGLSISTISRALRTPEAVTPQKRQIVLEAADKLGYIPNYYASNLKSHQSFNVGLIINDVQNPFFNKLIRSIETNLKDEKYKLLISFGLEEKSSIDDKIKNMLSLSVAGLLFSPNCTTPETERLLKQQNVYPLQLFVRMYENFDAITVDDFYGTYLATRRLLHSGHKKILIIGFDDAVFTERLKGFRQAFSDFNYPLSESCILKIADKEMLLNKISTKIIAENPTAIITVTDAIGTTTIKALNKLSLSIPDDISMVHYDDSAWADLLGITTIGHPIDLLGKKIAQAIIRGLNGKKIDYILNEKIDPIIIERSSIANISQKQ